MPPSDTYLVINNQTKQRTTTKDRPPDDYIKTGKVLYTAPDGTVSLWGPYTEQLAMTFTRFRPIQGEKPIAAPKAKAKKKAKQRDDDDD